MSFLQVKNNAASQLAAGIDNAVTSLTVAGGEGARFPSSNFHITIDDEILLCTSRTNDVLTVIRAREDTDAAAHALGAAVRLNITAAIIQELQFQSAARAYQTSPQTIPSATLTKVTFDAESYDLNDDFDLANGRFTAPEDREYQVNALLTYNGIADARVIRAYIKLNDSTYPSYSFAQTGTNGVATPSVGISDCLKLDKDDYIELYAYHNHGANRDLFPSEGTVFMSVAKVA